MTLQDNQSHVRDIDFELINPSSQTCCIQAPYGVGNNSAENKIQFCEFTITDNNGTGSGCVEITSDGISVITEKIYPERFMHISELNRMGARIMKEGASAIIKGTAKLSGAPVMASDLRASAALVLAGLVATGRTEISRVYHLDRGYKQMESKLSRLGARIWREKE